MKDPSKCRVHGSKASESEHKESGSESSIDKPEESDKIKVGSIPKERLKHISTGTFKDGKLKSGCHSQKGFIALQNQELLSDVETLENGVRIANVKDHPDRIKAERQGQTFFPDTWNDHKISTAVKDVWRENAKNLTEEKDEYQSFKGVYEGVVVTVGFMNGKPENAYPNKKQE